MADASDLTTVAYIYKRRYSDRQVTDVATREHPTLNRIMKRGGFNGSGFYYPITYSNAQGVGGTFATVQAAAAAIKGVQLAMLRKKKYGVITLDGEAIAAARGDKGSFFDLVTKHTDSILDEMGDSLAFDLFRSGNGQRGRRSSASTNVITLTDANDVRNFKVGMTVIASSNSDGSSPRSGSTTVSAVSRSAGTITLTSAAAISSFTNNDYLFRAGDPGTCMEGMETCTPLTAPTSGDSFRGIDRSTDVEALAGSRYDDTNGLIEENFGLVAVNISTMGKKVKEGALYPTNFWQVVRRLNAKVEYQSAGGTADYGFEYVQLHTPGGTIKLYSDPDVPTNRGRCWHPDAHCIMHLDEFIHIIKDDGRPSLRGTSTDGIEIRARHMGNYLQDDTAAHGVISI